MHGFIKWKAKCFLNLTDKMKAITVWELQAVTSDTVPFVLQRCSPDRDPINMEVFYKDHMGIWQWAREGSEHITLRAHNSHVSHGQSVSLGRDWAQFSKNLAGIRPGEFWSYLTHVWKSLLFMLKAILLWHVQVGHRMEGFLIASLCSYDRSWWWWRPWWWWWWQQWRWLQRQQWW